MKFQFLDKVDNIVYEIMADTKESAWNDLCDFLGTEYVSENVVEM